MNPQEWQENYARTSDRLPHSGWAAFGPFEDKRVKLADRIIFWTCAIAALVAWWLP